MNPKEAITIVKEANIEQLLREKSIDNDHIEKVKHDKLNQYLHFGEYYDYVDEPRLEQLVNVDRIIEIGRASSQYSILENASGKVSSELNVYRMATAIQSIQNNNLIGLYRWYEHECEPVRLRHYVDDNLYGVSSDGNHRCLYAKLIGAPFIRAIVSTNKINPDKKKNFDYFQMLKRKYSIVSIRGELFGHSNTVSVEFAYKGTLYAVYGYIYRNSSNAKSEFENLESLNKQIQMDFDMLSKYPFTKDGKLPRFLIWALGHRDKNEDSWQRVLDHYKKRLGDNNTSYEDLHRIR